MSSKDETDEELVGVMKGLRGSIKKLNENTTRLSLILIVIAIVSILVVSFTTEPFLKGAAIASGAMLMIWVLIWQIVRKK